MVKRIIRDILRTEEAGTHLMVSGWVRTRRDSGGISFIELSDGSGIKNLQAVIDRSETAIDDEDLKKIQTGASVSLSGEIVASPAKGQRIELRVREVYILGEVPEGYPLQKKRHSFEFLREISHLRPRTNTMGAVARVRSSVSFLIHRFFQENGFVYVHTPIITGSDAEGAGEMFQVTTLDAINAGTDYASDFFGKKTHLTVSGQLQGEAYATALTNIYTFGPTFRAENSNTTRHAAEFWMVEPEMSFCDINGDMDLAEDFIKFLIRELLVVCDEEMEFFDKWIKKGIIEEINSVARADFGRMTYTEAIEHLDKSGESFAFKPEWGCDLQTEHEKFLTEKVVKGPLIVTDYPRGIKAFYMKQNDDGKTVRGMDVLVPRLGEIIGGSQREDDLEKLRNRIKESGGEESDYDWYLDLRRFGSVPHAGFGLGLERFILYVTGMQNIRDVIPFPRTVNSISF